MTISFLNVSKENLTMNNENKRMLIKIAYYYYKLGMTQEEIAHQLSMSRQKVNRLVNSLIEEGIITIKINGYENSYVKLEEQLEKKFNLKEVIITSKDENVELIEKLGITAAKYLENKISNKTTIGVSWGKTLACAAENLSKLKRRDISVVQLVGGGNSKDISIKADEITRSLASKMNGTPYLLYAPTIVKNKTIRDMIINEDSIRTTFNIIKKCDMALIGIGDMSENSTLFKQKYLSKDEIHRLKKSNCVGDICLRTYDINGNNISSDLDNRVIGISMDMLKEIPLVIAAAGGKEKTEAIIGALRSGSIDVLITDNETAESILSIS